METLKDLSDFVFFAIDLPLQLEENRRKYIQAHQCSSSYLQTGIVPDDRIKEAQNKIEKILYIHDNKKDNPDSYFDMRKEMFGLIDIIADFIGCTTVRNKYSIILRAGIYITIHNAISFCNINE